MIEVEAKYRCENVEEVESNLLHKGFKLLETRVEEDIYFKHPCRDFGETDEALRVRRIFKEGSVGIEVTYKGPRLSGAGVKEREEITIHLSEHDYKTVVSLLERLGFRKVAVVRKKRKIYGSGGVQVVLDNVDNLGSFVEVEVVSKTGGKNLADEIKSIIGTIGVKGRMIEKTYLELLLEKRRS